MAYTPPTNSLDIDFDFIDDGYTPPVNSQAIDFNFADAVIERILAGTSTNFSSIWADPTASLVAGRFQIASRGFGAALSIVTIDDNTLYDSYTTAASGVGRLGGPLDSRHVLDMIAL
jgi:hypothetical protein